MTVMSQFRAEKKPLGAVFRSKRSWATAQRGHEPHSNAKTLAQHLAKHTRGAAAHLIAGMEPEPGAGAAPGMRTEGRDPAPPRLPAAGGKEHLHLLLLPSRWHFSF